MNEADVIGAIARVFRAADALGDALADDTAPLPPVPPGCERIVTADLVAEGRDFDRALYPLEHAGFRAIVQNLSDVAAAGAVPVGFVWSLAIPKTTTLDDVVRFAGGAARAAALHRCPLLGGDLSRTDGPLLCAVTMFGDVHGKSHKRTGAKVGDAVWVSRPTGASAAGLRALKAGVRADDAAAAAADALALALRAHLQPTPELALGQALVGKATSCMDVSDGLLLDLWRLAAASGVALELSSLDAAIDVAAGATTADAYGGGEDWALVFTTAPETVPPAGAIRLGDVVAGAGLLRDGQPLPAQGWDHFAT